MELQHALGIDLVLGQPEGGARCVSPTFPTRRKNRMNSMGAYRRSPLQGGGRDASSCCCCCCCDAWVWLWRQIELEQFDQQLLVGVEFRVAAHDQGSAISRREMHIEHLHGGKLVEHRSRREARRQRFEPGA